MQRDHHIDLIRVIAMTAVIFSHAWRPMTDAATFGSIDMFNTGPVLFFLCSGALIFPVAAPGKFIKRRLMRLLPSFVVWSVIYLLLDYYVSDMREVSIAHRLCYIFFTPTWGEGWFVLTIIGLYFMAVFASPWLERASCRSVTWFVALWACAGLTPWISAQTPLITASTPVWPFYSYFGYMVLGYWFTRWPICKRPVRQQVIFWSVVLVAGLIIPLRLYPTAVRWGYGQVFTDSISVNVMACAAAGFALLTTVRTPTGALMRAITSISRCSYGIYLFHSLLTRYILTRVCPDVPMLIAVPAILIISWLITLLWRKLTARPAAKIFSRLGID